jgi:hypothetical protein
MCALFLHHIHPPILPSTYPLSLVPTPQTAPVLPSVLWFCIRKKKT